MSFSVRFLDASLAAGLDMQEAHDLNSAYSRVELGHHFITFLSPLDYWEKGRYELQWEDGVGRLLSGSASCLVMGLQDPQRRYPVAIIELYVTGRYAVAVERHIFDELGLELFDPENPYPIVGPKPNDERGFRVPLVQIEAWLRSH